MHLKASFLGRIAAVAAMLLVAGAGAQAGSLEGHWILVEQHYGGGKANFAQLDAPVHLEFISVGGELTGKVWEGDDRAAAVTWPAFDAGSGLLPLQMERRLIDSRSGIARAEYRVQLSPPDGLVLGIIEEYQLKDKGESLEGTTTITFLGADGPRGSYTLHRRFERRP